MIVRTSLAAIVVALALATAATARQTVLVPCGTVRAAGWTFHVAHVGLPSCTVARALTKQIASLGMPTNGFKRYARTFLSLRCFASAKGARAQIQCTSGDGRKSLFAPATK